MEDAVHALKMAFAVFIFVIGLAIVFNMFGRAREVSDIVLARADNTYFDQYAYVEENDLNGRKVGIETIVPTLYRYYKEKFAVDIKDSNGAVLQKFDEEVERIVYSHKKNDKNTSRYEEVKAYYPDKVSWFGSNPNEDIRKRISAYIAGQADEINGVKLNSYLTNSLKDYRNKTFIETFTQKSIGDKKYEGDDGSVVYEVPGTTKLYITYTLNK